jgi:hypothetical protein
MKNILLIATFLLGVETFAQKTEFGLSYEGGIALSGKEKTIIGLNESMVYPVAEHLIRPHSIWNSHHLKFDVYPKCVKGLSLSVGLRMFTFGWEIDTIVGGYYVGSISLPTANGYWNTFYGRRESKYAYLTPTHCYIDFLHYQYNVSWDHLPAVDTTLFPLKQGN